MVPVFENAVNFLLAVVFMVIFALLVWVVLKLFERPIDAFINWLYLWGKSRREGLTIEQLRAKMAEEEKLHQEQIDQLRSTADLLREADSQRFAASDTLDPRIWGGSYLFRPVNFCTDETLANWNWVDKSQFFTKDEVEDNEESQEDTTDTK